MKGRELRRSKSLTSLLAEMPLLIEGESNNNDPDLNIIFNKNVVKNPNININPIISQNQINESTSLDHQSEITSNNKQPRSWVKSVKPSRGNAVLLPPNQNIINTNLNHNNIIPQQQQQSSSSSLSPSLSILSSSQAGISSRPREHISTMNLKGYNPIHSNNSNIIPNNPNNTINSNPSNPSNEKEKGGLSNSWKAKKGSSSSDSSESIKGDLETALGLLKKLKQAYVDSCEQNKVLIEKLKILQMENDMMKHLASKLEESQKQNQMKS